MLLDWIVREGGIVLAWWALATAAGLAALPLAMRLLPGLPDRGYSLARALGILLIAWLYWLLAVLGFLQNTTGGMMLAWAVVFAISLFVFLRGQRIDLRAYWRENRALIVATECIFLGLLVFWAIVRAHQNGLYATEKPMELAFISATMRSETFPPNDPWMAGYAISYYYLGYVIAAMFSMLSGVPSTMGFNLMITLLFALSGVTVFGVVYNLVRSNLLRRVLTTVQRNVASVAPPRPTVAIWTGLLGVVLLVLLGNFQVPIIEIPYQTGLGDAAYLSYWDAEERQQPVITPITDVADWSGWWWFRGARVLNDRFLNGERTEVIDEFPQFSFLLADVHPHVLALPFAILMVGLAANVLLSSRSPTWTQIGLYSLVAGGLIFLNTWDVPAYVLALVGAEGVRRLIARGTGRLAGNDWLRLLGLGAAVVGIGAVSVLPFLISFQSQLGGVVPNLIFPTLFRQFFVMFGPLLLLIGGWLLIEAWRGGRAMNWTLGLQVAFSLLLLLILAMVAFLALAALVPSLRGTVLGFVEENGGFGAVLPQVLQKRLTHILTSVILLLTIVVVVARLFPRRPANNTKGETNPAAYSPQVGFVLVLIAIGVLVTLGPEFLYLRDNFGTRMNTVFKLYYQAWGLWSIAGAYAVYSLYAEAGARVTSPVFKAAFGAVTVIALTAGMLYPILGIYWRTQAGELRAVEVSGQLTLDGVDSMRDYRLGTADDFAALTCFGDTISGDNYTVAQVVGGSYDGGTGLTGTVTGIPNLFNWAGHQGQWRGNTYGQIAGSRESDIETLYTDPTWRTTQAIIDQYGIDFIYFGSAEQGRYGAEAEIKFRDRLEVVCERGNARYFRVTPTQIAQGEGQ